MLHKAPHKFVISMLKEEERQKKHKSMYGLMAIMPWAKERGLRRDLIKMLKLKLRIMWSKFKVLNCSKGYSTSSS